MQSHTHIPAFGLYGESGEFPDVVHCEAFSARAPIHDWKIAPHRHGQIAQLFLVHSGSIHATVDDREWELGDGRFLFVPALSVHKFEFEPGTEGSVLSFPNSIIRSIGPNPGDLLAVLSQPFQGGLTEPLQHCTDMLRTEFDRASTFRPQIVVALAHVVLSLLADIRSQDAEGSKSPLSDHLGRLDMLIADHCAEGWSASDYASAMALSTGHLSRLCRTATGLGSTAYIERRVMAEACRMLAFTQLPVAEIGYRLGFSDPSYFSKRFRGSSGQSPSEYRAVFTT